jgi:hypothetical protein
LYFVNVDGKEKKRKKQKKYIVKVSVCLDFHLFIYVCMFCFMIKSQR